MSVPAANHEIWGERWTLDAFLAGTGLFLLAFVLHLAVWRSRVPRRQLGTLVVLFAAVLVAGLIAGAFYSWTSWVRPILAIGLYGSYVVVYVILFTAIEADSPTLTILGLIQARGDRGISHDELARIMAEHPYFQIRLGQMLRDGMAVKTGDRLVAGQHGHLLAKLVLRYRALLGRP